MELLETAGPVQTFAEPATDHVAELLAAVPPAPRPQPRGLPGVVLGTLAGWDEAGPACRLPRCPYGGAAASADDGRAPGR